MPWDLTLKRADGRPLGDVSSIERTIADVCPGVDFYREPSGAEKLSAVSHLAVPEAIRDHLQSRTAERQGDYEGEDFSLRFYLGRESEGIISAVDIEARGMTRNALPVLSRLAAVAGGVVIDSSGNVVTEASDA